MMDRMRGQWSTTIAIGAGVGALALGATLAMQSKVGGNDSPQLPTGFSVNAPPHAPPGVADAASPKREITRRIAASLLKVFKPGEFSLHSERENGVLKVQIRMHRELDGTYLSRLRTFFETQTARWFREKIEITIAKVPRPSRAAVTDGLDRPPAATGKVRDSSWRADPSAAVVLGPVAAYATGAWIALGFLSLVFWKSRALRRRWEPAPRFLSGAPTLLVSRPVEIGAIRDGSTPTPTGSQESPALFLSKLLLCFALKKIDETLDAQKTFRKLRLAQARAYRKEKARWKSEQRRLQAELKALHEQTDGLAHLWNQSVRENEELKEKFQAIKLMNAHLRLKSTVKAGPPDGDLARPGPAASVRETSGRLNADSDQPSRPRRSALPTPFVNVPVHAPIHAPIHAPSETPMGEKLAPSGFKSPESIRALAEEIARTGQMESQL